MARDRLTFRQRDLAATVKALKSAGVSVKRIEVRKDAVVLIPGEPENEPDIETEEAELARLREKFENAKI